MLALEQYLTLNYYSRVEVFYRANLVTGTNYVTYFVVKFTKHGAFAECYLYDRFIKFAL